MSLDPAALPPHVLEFLAQRHLATLTSLRADGSPHVVPVGFTWDDERGWAFDIAPSPGEIVDEFIARAGLPEGDDA